MKLYRVVISEVDLFNAGSRGIDVELPLGAVVVAVERADKFNWHITYYRGNL